MNPPWTMHNIKLNATDSHRMAFGKLTLNRKNDTWQVDFTGFTTAPITGEMWMVGDGARLVFDMAAKSGNMAYHKHLNMPKWDNFIFQARSVVVATSKKVLMIGDMPGKEPLNEVAIQAMIMAARRSDKPVSMVDKPKEAKTSAVMPAPKPITERDTKEAAPEVKVAEALSAPVIEPEPMVREPAKEKVETKAAPKDEVKEAPKVEIAKVEEQPKEPETKAKKEEKPLPPVIEPMLKDIPKDKVTIINLKGDKPEEKKEAPVEAKAEDKVEETEEDKLQAKIASIQEAPIRKAAEKLEEATAKSDEEHEKGEAVKKMLTREPLDRVTPPIKEFKMPEEEEKLPAKLLPVNWDIEHIKEALKGQPVKPPFAGTFNGSKFVRVEVTKAMGFNHIMVGEVPLGKLPVYMLCIPGSAARPPVGLPQFNRWIPARGGGGYWVKYLTPSPGSARGRREW